MPNLYNLNRDLTPKIYQVTSNISYQESPLPYKKGRGFINEKTSNLTLHILTYPKYGHQKRIPLSINFLHLFPLNASYLSSSKLSNLICVLPTYEIQLKKPSSPILPYIRHRSRSTKLKLSSLILPYLRHCSRSKSSLLFQI